jgi:Zinc-finger associated domain (zf-AD)
MEADKRSLNTCRCCLSTRNQLKDMNSEVLTAIPHLALIDVFKQCSGLEIDEQLTTKICQACDFKLQMSYEFREMCKLSDIALKQQVKAEAEKSASHSLAPVRKDMSLKDVRRSKSKRTNGASDHNTKRTRLSLPVIPLTPTSSGGPMDSDS